MDLRKILKMMIEGVIKFISSSILKGSSIQSAIWNHLDDIINNSIKATEA